MARAGPGGRRRRTERGRLGVHRRAGGVSRRPWGSLNLGGHVGDDPADVETNRARVAAAVGVPRERLLFMNQCHGADVHVVHDPGPARRRRSTPSSPPTADLALAVLVADCTPVLLADPAAGVVAAAHAGRPGMTSGIVARTVAVMRGLGATSITAAVGPSVCGRCYEVPPQMREEAAAVSAVSAAVSWTGTPAVDVAAGVVDQLHALDVAVRWVRDAPASHPTCTPTGGTGRQVAPRASYACCPAGATGERRRPAGAPAGAGQPARAGRGPHPRRLRRRGTGPRRRHARGGDQVLPRRRPRAAGRPRRRRRGGEP